MRALILSVFCALAGLSALALLLVPPRPPPGITPLVWASSSNPFRFPQIAYFNAHHPRLRVVLDSSNNRFDKIIVQTSSGVGPDLFDVLTGSYLQAYVEAGVAWDLTPVAAAHGIATDIDTWPAIHNEITYEGRQYGYPANVGTFIILYNKNIFDQFGVPYPDPARSVTWKEFITLLQRVSSRPSGGGGKERIWGTNAVDYSGPAPTPFFWKMVFYSRHGEFFSADGTRPTIATADMRSAFQWHRDALFNYQVLPTTVEIGAMSGQGGWGGAATTQFAEGHFATIISTKAALAALRGFVEEQKQDLARWRASPRRQAREPRPDVLRIGVMPLPHFAGRPRSGIALSQTVVINPASPHREQALTFLHFLASEAYADRVESYGIPGNPRQVRYDYPGTLPELAEHEITRCVVDSMRTGYQPRKSPFLLDSDVGRVLDEQAVRLEADPALSINQLLIEAQQELEALLQLNLKHNPQLAALYRARLAAAHAP